MRAKIIVNTVLFVFLAASIAFFAMKEARRRSPASSAGAGDDRTAARTVVIAYYFHGTRRCPTCRKIEEYAREAITEGFPEMLREKKLVWRAVNVDEPGNEHYIDDYRLSTKSVVLVRLVEGRETGWRNLPRIWDLVGDRAAFVEYIEDEVRDFEEGG